MRFLAYAILSGMAVLGIGGPAAAQSTGGPPKTPAAPTTPAMPAPAIPAPEAPAPETVAPAAPAAGGLLTFADPQELLDLAKGYGDASLDTNEQGDPLISGRLDGVNYLVLFYGCQNGASCRSIQFSTGYTDPFTAERANAWNYRYRWVKAYQIEGASSFRMDVEFQGGITRENLAAQFETWSGFIPTIRDFVAGKS